MSKTVDERVVEMRFDNKQFEKNVQTSMSTIDKLKKSLNLTGAAKGLENVNSAIKKCNMTPLTNSVEAVRVKFSSLEVVAVTALQNITNSAITAGKRIVSALTIDPIKTGFQEYETQINAVQTILANTSSKGTTLDQVNAALDELNHYADMTIYNFTEMTRNIGTFTAAGVDLDTSVSAIKGIANLAAVSGSTSQQASTAMYQLSQALAAGTVKLQDWNSVVNAGMGGQVFQDALKETARVHGIAIDQMIKDEGSFRETLQKGWLTSDILTETLAKFTGDLNEDQLRTMGYTEEQIASIIKMGQIANDAATKVKTFTQLFDTLKEAAQSGWTQSWEIIVGDFEEAKELLTEMSDVFSGLINKSAESRNNVLQGWKDLGGRTALIDSFRNVFEGIGKIIKPISEAFKDIFPPITAEQLYDLTVGFKNLTENLKISDETADKLGRTFKGAFSIVELFGKALGVVANAVSELVGSKGFSSVTDLLLDGAAAVGDFFTEFNEGVKTDGISEALSMLVSKISDLLESITSKTSSIGSTIAKAVNTILKPIKAVIDWITENISAGDIFAGLVGGGIFLLLEKLAGILGKVKKILSDISEFFSKKKEPSAFTASLTGILDSLHNALDSFTTGIKVSSLVSIAVAVGILSASLKIISEIKMVDVTKSLSAIGTMLTMLSVSFRSLTKSLTKFDSKGIIKAGASLILIAEAINVLADAMVKIADLSWEEVAKGLTGVGVGLIELSAGLKIIGKTKVSLSTSVAMLALAESCVILADATKQFGEMAWDEIGRGLTAMGGALGELTTSLAVLGKIGGGSSLFGSASIFVVVQSLSDLADALKQFGTMAWDEIGRGLTAMGGALGELGTVIGVLGKLTGISGILGSGAILIGIQGLSSLADALKQFGTMAWDEIGRGLTAMGGSLGELATVSGVLGKLTGFSGILGSGAILVAVQGLGDLADALKQFANMNWDEIGRGLVAMGGALGELAVVSGVLGSLAPLGGLVGSGSLVLAIQGLGDLADALQKFGEMDWDEIGRGLAAMGAALGELALGSVLNTLSGFGAEAISEVAAPLGTLADSVQKWSGITVPEGLGGKLSSLASGIRHFTFSGFGASALAEAAEPLGTLAGSIKKWATVTVPEGLEEGLKSLSNGVKSFTWAFVGGYSIDVVAEPLGALAKSVNKWKNVSVPETIKDDLTSLADGVKAFTWAFVSGWSIEGIIEPLNSLADVVSKWNGVTMPENIGENLKSLANGVKSFSDIGDISSTASDVDSIVGSVKKLSDVDTASSAAGLSVLADSLKNFSNIDVSSLETLPDMFVALAASMTASAAQFKTVGTAIMNALISGIQSKQASLLSAVMAMLTTALNNVNKKESAFRQAGEALVSALASGMRSKSSSVTTALGSSLGGAVSGIRAHWSSFYSAGSYLGQGVVSGINASAASVYRAGYNLGQQAVRGEMDGQQSRSPSRLGIKAGKYLGEGVVIGIGKMVSSVYDSGYDLGDTAVNSLSEAISRIAEFVDSDVDCQPTIRPVLDLSEIQNGTQQLDQMLGERSTMLAYRIGTVKSREQVMQEAADKMTRAVSSLSYGRADTEETPTGENYTITVPLYLEGREVARATAPFINDRQNQLRNRDLRNRGKVK